VTKRDLTATNNGLREGAAPLRGSIARNSCHTAALSRTAPTAAVSPRQNFSSLLTYNMYSVVEDPARRHRISPRQFDAIQPVRPFQEPVSIHKRSAMTRQPRGVASNSTRKARLQQLLSLLSELITGR